MNTGTTPNPVKIVIDTNILISAIGFGGKPKQILQFILEKEVEAITSPILLAELDDVISKKFPHLAGSFEIINKQIRKNFQIIRPKKSINILVDEDDDRVLEAALEGKCQYIITGDKHLLNLGNFKGIQILTPSQFLEMI